MPGFIYQLWALMRLGPVRKTRITGAELSELPTAGSSSAFRCGGSISTKRIGGLARIGTVNFLVWTVVAVLAVILLATVFARRAVGGVDPTTLTFDPDLIGRVRALALAGKPIPAIKLLREQTPGLGLAAAKTMVDRMVKSGLADRRPVTSSSTTVPAKPGSVMAADLAPSSSSVPLEVELQARSLIAAGQKLQAIKLVRASTSWDLRQAKDYVDTL